MESAAQLELKVWNAQSITLGHLGKPTLNGGGRNGKDCKCPGASGLFRHLILAILATVDGTLNWDTVN